jgi:malate synthase
MEDAATAEISRAQVWQQVHHGLALDDGRVVDMALVDGLIDAELARFAASLGAERYAAGRWANAAALMRELIGAERFVEFLTLPAYDRVLTPVAA